MKIFLATILLGINVSRSQALEIRSLSEAKYSAPDQISFAIKLKIEVEYPSMIKLLELKMKCMNDEMKLNPASKPLLDTSYTRAEDSLKLYNSQLAELLKNNVYEQKKSAEIQFQNWAKGKSEFENMLADFAKVYDSWRIYSKHRIYLNEAIAGSPLLTFAISMQLVENALVRQGGGDYRKAIEVLNAARKQFLLKESQAYDRNFLAQFMMLFYQDVPRNQQLIGFYEGMKGSFGDLKLENTYKKFITAAFSNTMFFDEAKWKAFMQNPDANVLQEDPAYNLASSFLKNWQGKYSIYYTQFITRKNELERIYKKGSLLMDQKKINTP